MKDEVASDLKAESRKLELEDVVEVVTGDVLALIDVVAKVAFSRGIDTDVEDEVVASSFRVVPSAPFEDDYV